jgi:hypothetical protein
MYESVFSFDLFIVTKYEGFSCRVVLYNLVDYLLISLDNQWLSF